MTQMTPRQAFKAEVMAQLAAAGRRPEDFAAIVKAAADALEKRAFPGETLLASGVNAVKTLSPYAMFGAVAAPLGVGALGGYAASKAQDDDTDVDAAKADELIQAYNQLTADAEARAKARGLRPAAVGV